MGIGKIKKYNLMWKYPRLRRNLPETHWLTRAKSKRMLKRYSTIFVKPNQGSGGNGIIRVQKKFNRYEVRCGNRRKYIRSKYVYQAIRSYKTKSDRYLVQRGLSLAKYNGSIFDIRVYMQKPGSKWTISGMVARVAAPNRYVTNYHKGGHGASLKRVLAKLFSNNRKKVANRLKRIETLSLFIARILSKQYPHLRELGIDFGMEANGRLWIIEANSKPGHQLFTQLANKKMLYKIRKNKRKIKKFYS